MTGVRSILVVIAVLTFWYFVIVSTPLIHQAIFAVVPPDGTVTTQDRARFDGAITKYVRYWSPNPADTNYPALTAEEQAHLDDVMMLNGIIFLYVFPAALLGLLLARFRLTESLALSWALALLFVISFVTVVGFNGTFTGIHSFLFPSGNWSFPSDRYLLTQVYPLGFFAAAWVLILTLSALTLWAIRARLQRNEPR